MTLSSPTSQTVSVDYATANGTALRGRGTTSATSGTAIFTPGTTTQTVTVQVVGNTDVRPESELQVESDQHHQRDANVAAGDRHDPERRSGRRLNIAGTSVRQQRERPGRDL